MQRYEEEHPDEPGFVDASLECFDVAPFIRGMTEDEVRALLDETHSSGLVQTLQDVTSFLSQPREQPTRNPADRRDPQ